MIPRIEILPEKKLVGKRLSMSFSNNKTFELWSSFMPRKQEIKNPAGTDLYSVEVYPELFFQSFNPNTEFDKWAAIEVSDYQLIPEEMHTLIIPAGMYAVFVHKGPASEGLKTYNYIFLTWLPKSEYLLDNRPHFALMGDKYKHEGPESEEEIWIPVKAKLL